MTRKITGSRAKVTKKKAAGPKIEIDHEFMKLLIPQTKEERAQLEMNLLAAGRCRDPLVVWKGHNILLDGHHRMEVCTKHNLPYDVVEIGLPDRETALCWIRDNQLGRRNLTPEAVSYLRGQHYNAEKKAHGGDRKSEESSGNNCHLKTEEELAKRYNVSARTIRNDGDFAESIDKITKTCNSDDFKTAILRREVKLTRHQVEELAKRDPEEQKVVVERVIERGMAIKQHADVAAPQMGVGALDKITVPTEPSALAKTLLRRLGPTVVAQVQIAIADVLAKHKAQHPDHQAKAKPKSSRKAATKAQ